MGKRRWVRRMLGVGAVAGILAVIVVAASTVWVSRQATGHVYDADSAPAAPVVIVLGAQVRDGKPMAFLSGRLDVAVQLVNDGRARAVLVSGDAGGKSGDEIAGMTEYLVANGIDRDLIVGDPYGLDTYDTCARAIHTYGVTKALIVTQEFHVPRAVALCRDAGIDTDGVNADCDCSVFASARNTIREPLARPKAVLDLLSGRDPAVVSARDDALAKALARQD
ncbi:SanA/YdcF family protein [Rhodococcus tibetensis]|uniref:YdcF family protein n=1 Tax=Rhodococcus tibetensis TaxID=2965064 RepID=A0ABT1QJF6_9NOCA|nr:ElyC/SanA/YdcF family protein [Rhodococcus sp. FXJ9.536]MCQ4121210.1 YdcF family protein [Rhodococcus sp. FXJ9.536]